MLLVVFGALVATGLPLVVADSVSSPEFRRRFRPDEPCVVLAGHPSLRGGDARHAAIATDADGADLLRRAAVVAIGGITPDNAAPVIQAGADDFLPKSDLTTSVLERSLRHAAARRRGGAARCRGSRP